MLAYHFVGHTLRNGDPIPPDGKWLVWDGPVKMCESGLHASRQPFDALRYATGNVLCRVEVRDIMGEQDDKLVCRRRRIIRRGDVTEMLRYFARMQALSVVHLWDAPQIVLDYLNTGDAKLRDAAWHAALKPGRHRALDIAREAAWHAARPAGEVWSDALSAAWEAARATGVATAGRAARTATWDAARKDFAQLVKECGL